MRVFEMDSYNLKQLRFKENKDFFDSLLREHQFAYTDVAFTFKFGHREKVSGFFPELDKYWQDIVRKEFSYPEKIFSSVFVDARDNVSLHLDREHLEPFDRLLKKIPNPINFGFMGVVLDNVNWYGDAAQPPVFSKRKRELVGDSLFHCYFSNSVRFRKEFDYGNKLNLADVLIDRTGDADALAPYPARFEEFLSKLGKPKWRARKCVFDEPERARLDAEHERLRGLMKAREGAYSEKFGGFACDGDDWVLMSVTPMKGFSPKRILSGYAEEAGYRYAGYQYGIYQFQKLSPDNHLFFVEFDTGTCSSHVFASVSAKGYNFSHEICSTTQIAVRKSDDLTEYAKLVFETARQAESDWSGELLRAYGETPKWFFAYGETPNRTFPLD